MRWLPSFALSLWCAVSAGATLSGKISDPANNGVAASEVRLWARAGKGFSFTATGGQLVMTAGDGTFTFNNVPAGDYLVDTRPSGGFGDRWYDTDGNGYVAQDADLVHLVSGQVRTG